MNGDGRTLRWGSVGDGRRSWPPGMAGDLRAAGPGVVTALLAFSSARLLCEESASRLRGPQQQAFRGGGARSARPSKHGRVRPAVPVRQPHTDRPAGSASSSAGSAHEMSMLGLVALDGDDEPMATGRPARRPIARAAPCGDMGQVARRRGESISAWGSASGSCGVAS